MNETKSLPKKILSGVGKGFLILITLVIAVALTLFICIKMICSNISPTAKRVFVTTMLETGQLKFLASWFVSDAEIQELVNSNSMAEFNKEVDTSKIVINSNVFSSNGTKGDETKDVEKIEISGKTFYATMLIVKDPSRISVASIYPWQEYGITLDKLVEQNGALGGINGGIYNSNNNTGGTPYGVLVSNGEIQLNEPQQFSGLVLIGLTEDNILQIINIDGKTKSDIEQLVADLRIRDAVTFQEESSDANNHFVQLVINGEARELNGMGSGLNPRTAIGQRADGSLLLLVTDGRGKSGHLGASASDLINIMTEYEAVNAANLDGGSSSCMYYDGEYLMTSVTFYYSNSSWRLPAGFIIK